MRHQDSDKYWYENLGEKMFTRCTWKKTEENMKLAQCGAVNKVPSHATVLGPIVGDYHSSNDLSEDDVGKAKHLAGHAEVS